jgi:hypothetical protein
VLSPRPDGTLLRHDSDLLRQRRPPRRARVHHGDRGRDPALSPARRRRDLVRHRDRRARSEDRAQGSRGAGSTEGLRRPDQHPLQGRLAEARRRLRSLHPDDRSGPRGLRRRALEEDSGEGRSLPRRLRGLLLRRLRVVQDGEGARAGEHLRPPQEAGREGEGADLLLRLEEVREAAPRVLRAPAEVHPAGDATERGPLLRPVRARGSVLLPDDVLLGDPGPRRSEARDVRLVRRALQLPERARRRGPHPVLGAEIEGRPPRRKGHPPVSHSLLAGVPHGRRLLRRGAPGRGVRSRISHHRRRQDVEGAEERRSSVRTSSATTSSGRSPSARTATSITRPSSSATTPISGRTSETSSAASSGSAPR